MKIQAVASALMAGAAVLPAFAMASSWSLVESSSRTPRCDQPSSPNSHHNVVLPAAFTFPHDLGGCCELGRLTEFHLGRPVTYPIISGMLPNQLSPDLPGERRKDIAV